MVGILCMPFSGKITTNFRKIIGLTPIFYLFSFQDGVKSLPFLLTFFVIFYYKVTWYGEYAITVSLF